MFGEPQIMHTDSLKKTASLNYGNSYTQNNLSEIPAVHDLGFSGAGVYIGILDNGFNYGNQTALKNLNVVKTYNYATKTTDVSNTDTHGTGVFSIMAGYNSGVMIGPAYGAKFYLAKTEVDGSESKAEEDNYVAALQDMESAGVDITSSSLGYTTFDNTATSYTYANMNGSTAISTVALNHAFDLGVSTFTAAGNDGSGTWHYIGAPADAINVMTIGAVTSLNALSDFSSRGPTYDGRVKPEVVAMGSSVYHAVSTNTYTWGDGTSYATPIAAGIGALLKSCWPHLTNVQMRKIFLECGDNATSPNNNRGWGLISAKRAVCYPNLSLSSSVYTLNKIFVDANGVNSSTVKLNYKIGSSSFQSVSLNYDGSLKYNYALPTSTSGSLIEFYFTYTNNNSVSVREPSGTTNYKFSYGTWLISGINENSNSEMPTQFNLSQNYPNPFNPSTVISYQLFSRSKVSLKVYDILGREVATLVNEEQQPGVYNSKFSILNSQLSSGIYFYRLQTKDYSATKKMILLK
jgi:serine protease AprX